METLLGGLALLSFATFVLSLLLLPWLVGRLPADCFLCLADSGQCRKKITGTGLALSVLRNLFGALLLVAGILMLFLPGQGLLTILLGLLLLSFPGKGRLLLFATRGPKTRLGLDWLRRKSGREPFLWPGSDQQGNL